MTIYNLPVEYDKLPPSEKRLVRLQYIKEQGGNCYYCAKPLANVAPKEVTSKRINWRYFPPNFLKYPVHLHHDHRTGLTLGAVHNYCNAVLWQYHGE